MSLLCVHVCVCVILSTQFLLLCLLILCFTTLIFFPFLLHFNLNIPLSGFKYFPVCIFRCLCCFCILVCCFYKASYFAVISAWFFECQWLDFPSLLICFWNISFSVASCRCLSLTQYMVQTQQNSVRLDNEGVKQIQMYMLVSIIMLSKTGTFATKSTLVPCDCNIIPIIYITLILSMPNKWKRLCYSISSRNVIFNC